MPRSSPLPPQLRYLAPFRKELAGLPADEVEYADPSLLHKLLRKRIQGLSAEEAKKTLAEDQAMLDEWLSVPHRDSDRLVFLKGYLMALPELVDRLLEEDDGPTSQDEIQMEFPAEMKARKIGVGWRANWLRTKFFVFPGETGVTSYPEAKLTTTSVTFGNVTGWKHFVDFSLAETIHVHYSLAVPGGEASVDLIKKGKHIDESRFE